jgi:tetratricopeptide (TPR) repeat protein
MSLKSVQLLTFFLSSLFWLQSCTNLPITTEETSKSSPALDSTPSNIEAEPEPQRYGSFTTDTLYSLLVAELASTRQIYDLTLQNYIHEARSTEDLGVIARATRLAQYFRAHDDALEMGTDWLAQAPNDIEANAIVATSYINKREPLKALDYAEKILSLINPEDEQANRRAALTETIANYSRDLDTLTRERLIQRYRLLITQYPQYPAIKVGLSVLYTAAKDTAQAYELVKEALAQENQYLPAIMQEIRLLQTSQQTDLAIQKLKAYLKDGQSENYRLRLLYARLLTQTDIEAAYEEFVYLSEQSPTHLDIKFSRALVALELKKREEAQRLLLELLAVQYRPNTIHFYLGNLDEVDKRYEQAIKHYLSITAGEDYIAGHSRAARIMAIQGDIEAAQSHFTQLRSQSPHQRPQLYNAEAEVLEGLEKIDAAILILDQGVNEFPDNVDLRYTRSSLYEKNNQLTLMESDLRHILSLEPENAAALNALGYFLTNRTHRHYEALELIQQAIAIRPDDPAIIDSLGWALFNLGRTEEAIEYLRKAYELFPDPEVAAHLGEALWVNGKKQEAHSIWTNNLKENPNDSRIIDTMQRLNVNK